jgi:tRNA (guanine37-N1)-methyltransferase
MHFHIITLFPDSISCYVNSSILKRAQESKKISISFYNPREFTNNKHNKVDHKPYGGGPGMVLQAEPVIKAIEKAKGKKRNVKIIWLTPAGKTFTNILAKKYATAKSSNHLIFVCGRYEGIDSRVKQVFKKDIEEISIGDFVLTGGELPSVVMIDAISRQIEGVLGNTESPEELRISSHDSYTRPEVFIYKKKKYSVPKVLTSGNHKEIDIHRMNKLSKKVVDK